MDNILTRKEIIEHLAFAKLKFSMYSANRFVFSGEDHDGNMVMMFVKNSSLAYVSPKTLIHVTDFSDLSVEHINFIVLNKNLEIIYQD